MVIIGIIIVRVVRENINAIVIIYVSTWHYIVL